MKEIVYGVVYCIEGIWTLHDQMWEEAGPAAQSMRDVQIKAQMDHMSRHPGSQLRTAAMPIAIRTSILESWSNARNKSEESKIQSKDEVEVKTEASTQPDRAPKLS
jgi:hypothetical protein